MLIFLGCFAIVGIGFLLCYMSDEHGKSKMGEKEWEDYQIASLEYKEKKKYHDYMFTCPMCSSKKIKKLSDLNRAGSIALKGLASDKIGKSYECDNCKYKF